MLLSKEKLFQMKVRARSGTFLGRVVDISFDTDSQSVLQYHVRVPYGIKRLLPFLFKSHTLFISHTQIIQWKEKEIIVEDLRVHLYGAEKKTSIRAQENPTIASCSSTDRAAPS